MLRESSLHTALSGIGRQLGTPTTIYEGDPFQ